MRSSSISAGSVVRLLSGGPAMVVSHVDANGDAVCRYWCRSYKESTPNISKEISPACLSVTVPVVALELVKGIDKRNARR